MSDSLPAIVLVLFYLGPTVGTFLAIRNSCKFQQRTGIARYIIAALAAIIWPAVFFGIVLEDFIDLEMRIRR